MCRKGSACVKYEEFINREIKVDIYKNQINLLQLFAEIIQHLREIKLEMMY